MMGQALIDSNSIRKFPKTKKSHSYEKFSPYRNLEILPHSAEKILNKREIMFDRASKSNSPKKERKKVGSTSSKATQFKGHYYYYYSNKFTMNSMNMSKIQLESVEDKFKTFSFKDSRSVIDLKDSFYSHKSGMHDRSFNNPTFTFPIQKKIKTGRESGLLDKEFYKFNLQKKEAISDSTRPSENMAFSKSHTSGLDLKNYNNLLTCNSIENLLKLINLKQPDNIIDKYIFNNINFITDNTHYSRNLQEIISYKVDKDDINLDIYINHLMPNLIKLSQSKFGNYLIQHLIENCRQNQLELLYHVIRKSFSSLAFSPYGTRVIQKIIENSHSVSIVNSILNSLKERLLEYMTTQYSIYIVFVFLKTFPDHSSLVFSVLIKHLAEVCCSKSGCCLIQKIIDTFERNRFVIKLVDGIVLDCFKLLKDSIGHYSVQCILRNDYKFPSEVHRIKQVILENLRGLARFKHFGSFIEMVIPIERREFNVGLAAKLLNDDAFNDLISFPSGAFIIQKLLRRISNPYYKLLLKKIKGISLESFTKTDRIIKTIFQEHNLEISDDPNHD